MILCGRDWSTGKTPSIICIERLKSLKGLTEENREAFNKELKVVRKRLEKLFSSPCEGDSILRMLEDYFKICSLNPNYVVISKEAAKAYFERKEIRHG